MPTWDEVREYARSKYKLSEEGENHFKMTWQFGNDRLQAIIVSRFQAFDRDWADFASACCKKDQMSPEVALEKNWNFAVGAICLDREFYVVRYTCQMATMDMEEFELPLSVIASTADQIEQEFAAEDNF